MKWKEPRLRDWNLNGISNIEALIHTWNEKNLDYEIETIDAAARTEGLRNAWNEKNLDYEIETYRDMDDSLGLTYTWNEKNLDYEIETCVGAGDPWVAGAALKWKEPRLRDWNAAALAVMRTADRLYSLKWKEPRLRDWNSETNPGGGISLKAWNEKNLDYEIETMDSNAGIMKVLNAWNEKNLDYEIETRLCALRFRHHLTWNEKNLDYEIETWCRRSDKSHFQGLEMKRTSITRLKQISFLVLWAIWTTWNEKNLDYEIETTVRGKHNASDTRLEMKRTSITRLKPSI